ncbi:hypothetical protein [Yersinia frederiksenii]|nr:hypothetical protein [Yersinia frederiksenii]
MLAKNYSPLLFSMLNVIISGALDVWINNHNDERLATEGKLTVNEKSLVEKLAKFDAACHLPTSWKDLIISSEEEQLKYS